MSFYQTKTRIMLLTGRSDDKPHGRGVKDYQDQPRAFLPAGISYKPVPGILRQRVLKKRESTLQSKRKSPVPTRTRTGNVPTLPKRLSYRATVRRLRVKMLITPPVPDGHWPSLKLHTTKPLGGFGDRLVFHARCGVHLKSASAAKITSDCRHRCARRHSTRNHASTIEVLALARVWGRSISRSITRSFSFPIDDRFETRNPKPKIQKPNTRRLILATLPECPLVTQILMVRNSIPSKEPRLLM
ncbi:hypothetical protein GGS20DRAFT_271226 [Poronia punctata]|nr:hypothetical protein GGS20DRAFT_271226 [Poronia punctata]